VACGVWRLGVCLVGVLRVGVLRVGVCLVGVLRVGVWCLGVEGEASPVSIPPFKLSLKYLFLLIIFFLCVFLFRNNNFFIIKTLYIYVCIYFF
jgi:hypothetical protein